MISSSTLAVFVVTAAVLVAIPGPNHLYIAARGIAQGRGAGVASAFGVEAGTLVHIAAAAAGLSYVVAQSATLFSVVKWAGAAYLIYLGVRTLTGKGELDVAAVGARPLRRIFVEGMVVNVLNPKTVLFFLAFLPQFVEPGAGSPALQVVVLGLVLALIGLVSDLLYAMGAGAIGGRLRRRARLLRYVSGGVYLALGVATAAAGSGRGNG